MDLKQEFADKFNKTDLVGDVALIYHSGFLKRGKSLDEIRNASVEAVEVVWPRYLSGEFTSDMLDVEVRNIFKACLAIRDRLLGAPWAAKVAA